MRTLDIQAGSYTATINTNDKVCEAFGKCFLNISFSSFATIPAKVKLLHGSHEFEKSVNSADVANIHAFFDLSWFKYFAPKFGTKEIKIEIKFDGYWVGEINYTLTAGRGEIIPRNSNNRLSWDYDWKPFADEIVVVCPTQKTKHAILEEMVFLNSAEFDEGWLVDFDVFLKTNKAKLKLANGYNFQPLTIFDDNIDLSLIIENKDEDISEIIGKFKAPKTNDCYDIEIRITNKYGLRGVMGGKMIDASEGGDDVKSNFGTITPYNGIHCHEKIGQKIQKEVFFDCEGDADLLGLLRDACVYGVCEWYDERIEQWLPCQVVDNSIDTDPFKEQSITFILQQL